MATSNRKTTVQGRRYPRFHLDVDWFVESKGSSSLGRGVELSVRGALLPVACTSPFTTEVTLFLSLPARPQMFKARCSAQMLAGRGWFLRFEEIAPEDLQLLGHTLLSEFGTAALPNLERRSPHALEL
ncbi:MAG: hypothetical protein ACOZQL_31555 [Myxococcota bacterium]